MSRPLRFASLQIPRAISVESLRFPMDGKRFVEHRAVSFRVAGTCRARTSQDRQPPGSSHGGPRRGSASGRNAEMERKRWAATLCSISQLPPAATFRARTSSTCALKFLPSGVHDPPSTTLLLPRDASPQCMAPPARMRFHMELEARSSVTRPRHGTGSSLLRDSTFHSVLPESLPLQYLCKWCPPGRHGGR